MSYRVVFNHPTLKKNFEKMLEKISPDLRAKIIRSVMDLSENPRPQGIVKIKPPLDIHHSLAQYRVRIQNYRILYDIDDPGKIVSVIALRKRNEDTYRK